MTTSTDTTNPSAVTRRTALRASLSAIPLLAAPALAQAASAPLGAPEPAPTGARRDALLDRYIAFLAHEHAEALWMLEPECSRRSRHQVPMHWFPDAPDVVRLVQGADPATRAALVMRAAGVEVRS